MPPHSYGGREKSLAEKVKVETSRIEKDGKDIMGDVKDAAQGALEDVKKKVVK